MSTTFVQDSTYSSVTTNADDSEKTVNLRLDCFDVSMTNTTDADYDLSAVVHTIDFSATGVIFVKTQDMRTTFQFAVDADHLTDVGNAEFDAGIRFYVFDSKDPSKNDLSFVPTWNWDVDASASDASYILQPAHAMMDVSNHAIKDGHKSDGKIPFTRPLKFNPRGDDNDIREDSLVKQDFVRHIAQTVLKGADLAGLFSNVDDLLLSIENGGVTAWDTIRGNLAAARDANPLTNDEPNLVKNPTRALYRQLIDRNPDRFEASANDVDFKIKNTSNPQPLPFVDGDILEFTFKINSDNVSVPDESNDISQVPISSRTYRIKLCMVDGSGNNDEYNVKPPEYVYDFGTSAYGDISNSNKEGSKVEALLKHQRYYEMDASAGTPTPPTPPVNNFGPDVFVNSNQLPPSSSISRTGSTLTVPLQNPANFGDITTYDYDTVSQLSNSYQIASASINGSDLVIQFKEQTHAENVVTNFDGSGFTLRDTTTDTVTRSNTIVENNISTWSYNPNSIPKVYSVTLNNAEDTLDDATYTSIVIIDQNSDETYYDINTYYTTNGNTIINFKASVDIDRPGQNGSFYFST